MAQKVYILILMLLTSLGSVAQQGNAQGQMQIKGSVKGKENYAPISGVRVSTDKGAFTTTNALGEFVIRASVGDILMVEGPEL
ncbi:MAG TPA: sensor histidine kinase, partial [Muricauda sp.]|nr:sensor histidine kinase [Allomuricauda sp.]